jgi:V8-like Glu-specific endopeptidase
MSYLPPNDINDIVNAIMSTIGYGPSIRRLFLANINPDFRNLMDVDDLPLIQLNLDLVKLNDTGRLVDGSIPLETWLAKAVFFLKPHPAESNIIQKAQSVLAEKTATTAPLAAVAPPSAAAVSVAEKIILRNDMVSFSFLQAGTQVGNAIARMKVARYEAGHLKEQSPGEPLIYLGTGWLLTPDLVITNHHVIHARDQNEASASSGDFNLQALNALVEFDYNKDYVEGNISRVSRLEAFNSTLDFVILRLDHPVNRYIPRLLPERVLVDSDDPQVVNIIQHPFGQAKKVALRNNHIFDATYPKVRYFTDTEGGSSGSIVCNDNWQAIALHRAGAFVNNVPYNGQTTAWVNEGVQLHAIIGFLEQQAPDLAQEIAAVHDLPAPVV